MWERVMSTNKHGGWARWRRGALALLGMTTSVATGAQAQFHRPDAPMPPSMTVAACPQPPKPVRDLDIPRFYADAEGSKTDPELERLHAAAVEPLVAFVREIVDAADKAARGNTARGACALEWLTAWASGDAWLGQMITRQAEYQRKWDLGGIALAYIKLRPQARPEHRRVIEPWLKRWAATSRAFFDAPGRQRNNHWYWLGLGMMATAIATDSDEHWQAARAIYRDGLRDIQANGTLPLEMQRQSRALFYHVFAMTPLVMMAEIGTRRGEDWYGMESGSLHRLVDLCLRGLVDPATFERIAGKSQEKPVNARAGWLTPYRTRFPERMPPGPLPDVASKHRWLGGDVDVLMRVIQGPSR